MSDDEIEKILKDMEKQGFPLEIKISEIIEAHGWAVANQASYTDLETKKSRTIDILAERNVYYASNLVFDIWLCVECKKVKKPWVFYTTDINVQIPRFQREIISSTHFSINKVAKKGSNFERISKVILGSFILQSCYSQSIFKKLAHNSFEPFTKGEGVSIHKARMQVSNMILDLEKNVSSDTLSMITVPYLILYLPVIVVDGKVFVFQNNQLTEVEGLHYHVSYHQSSFIIDVVTAKSFEKYLSNLEQFISNFKA